MKSALDIMNLWNKSNISKVLRIKTADILSYRHIEPIFQHFQQIVEFLNANQQELSTYHNLIALVHQRKTQIITKVYENMCKSIVEYGSEEEYTIKFGQYEFILENNLIGLITDRKV